jgi:PhnB protein
MQVQPYVSFKGDCEAAFKLYERCLGGRIETLFRYGGSPMADQVPPGWADKVMHASLTLDGMVLLGADVEPTRYEPPKGFSLSIQVNDVAAAERVFLELSEGGRVMMPLEKTFWAERFGMVADRFGIPWLINCEI